MEAESLRGREVGVALRPPLGLLACFAIGVGAALVGLLPWLLTGMRLPLQNLWATDRAPDSMPVALLPLSQYTVTLVAALVVTGSAIAGLVTRATRGRRVRRGGALLAVGVLLPQAAAAVQSAVVVSDGLETSSWARFYLLAVTAVAVVSVVLGILVLLLTARARVPGAAIGFSVAALAAGIWLDSLLVPFGSAPADGTVMMLGLTHWVPAILVGAALAWCGFSTAGRIVAAVAGLLILWIGSAAITAVSAAAGTRTLLSRPTEMLDYGLAVFRMAVGIPELVLPPLLLALAIGVVGFFALRAARRRAR